ncbi:hypothetical protein FHR71_005572 [Methylobacterium sp. RAS18]|nr:hypothetical protein [Methylobacterium sp. RAS18]
MTPEQKIAEMEADIAFLLLRAGSAGSASFSSGRWTGLSSNALVSVAYGGEQHTMPGDRSDYAACVRTYARLPKHRRTPTVRAALRAAKAALIERWPECRTARARNEAMARWREEDARRARERTRRRRTA